jgi:hypothetical protein
MPATFNLTAFQAHVEVHTSDPRRSPARSPATASGDKTPPSWTAASYYLFMPGTGYASKDGPRAKDAK